MEQTKFKKICGYCNKQLSKDGICKEVGCMYNGAKQLNPQSEYLIKWKCKYCNMTLGYIPKDKKCPNFTCNRRF